MAKKIIVVVWRTPDGNATQEQFDDTFKMHTEASWLKINGPDGPVRFIPSDKVCLVQFAEAAEDKPRILRPDMVAPAGLKSVPS